MQSVKAGWNATKAGWNAINFWSGKSKKNEDELELQESLIGADEKEDVREQMAAMNTVLEDVCNPNNESDQSGGNTQVAPSQVREGGVRSYDKDMQGYGVVGMLDVLEGILDNYKEMNKTCDSIETSMKDMQKQAATDMQELKDKMEADGQKAATDMQELKDKMEADRQRAEADMNDLKRMMGMLLKDRAPRREESEERKVSFAEKENRKRELGEKNQRR